MKCLCGAEVSRCISEHTCDRELLQLVAGCESSACEGHSVKKSEADAGTANYIKAYNQPSRDVKLQSEGSVLVPPQIVCCCCSRYFLLLVLLWIYIISKLWSIMNLFLLGALCK